MARRNGPTRSGWRGAGIIFLLCFFSYALFLTRGDGANEVPRLALALEIVESGSVTIDEFAPSTVDRASVGGHYYLDKAPGSSLLALPLAFVTSRLINPGGAIDGWVTAVPGADHPLFTWRYTLFAELTMLLLSALPTAAAAAALFLLAERLGVSAAAASFAALAYGLASPAWGWSTLVFGHALCGALLFLGFAVAAFGRATDKASLARCFGSGVLLGAAACVEFPGGPAAALIVAATAFDAGLRRGFGAFFCSGFAQSAGLLLALVPLGLYDLAAFGSPFKIGYGFVSEAGQHQGFFGVMLPHLDVVYQILLGRFRGLFVFAPVLALAPLGAVLCWRDPQWRFAGLVATAVALWFVVLNAGYVYWDGGWSSGPRHLTPMLPFLALMLARLWPALSPGLRWPAGALLAASAAIALACAAVTMAAPEDIADPLAQLILPHFFAGDLPRFLTVRLLGPGFLNLLPLLALWLGGVLLLRRTIATGDGRRGTVPLTAS